LEVERELKLPILYDGVRLDSALRIDLVVASRIIVETKSVEKHITVHEAQLFTYLKLTGHTLGFLVNFNVPLIKDGIKRVIRSQNRAPQESPK
jgi:GxxExxY protein